MKMNLLLAGLLVSAPAHAAMFDGEIVQGALDAGAKGKVLFTNLADKLVAKDFTSLENDLNAFLRMSQAFMANNDNTDAIQNGLLKAVQVMPLNLIPDQYQDFINDAKKIQQDAATMIPYAIKQAKMNMPKLGPNQVHKLIQGLQILRDKAPAAYAALKDDLNGYYTGTLKTVFDSFNKTMNLGVDKIVTNLKDAEKLIAKVMSGEAIDSGDLPTIATAYRYLNSIVPLIPQLIKGTAELASRINNKFNIKNNAQVAIGQLPQDVTDALAAIINYAGQFEHSFTQAQEAVNHALGK